ncbi:MAG: hypothetical protein H6835_17640 [Planctomycetes bacterium]|nr:hypothetical protein [Planctomycetota bacterium]
MRLPSPAVSLISAAALSVAVANLAPLSTSTDTAMPGTQPLEAALLGPLPACDGCHGYYDQDVEPVENWMGSMMSHAGRDPVFWAALGVAEGDLPGAGDFCLRCHAPRGWQEGRAFPTDGSALDPMLDQYGVECGLCHQLVNPDKSEHGGVQYLPYVANDGGNPVEGYYGSGMAVLAGNQTRYGPYASTTAGHPFVQSKFHRSAEICGTCHDVSNPVTGDLAANNGAMTPLPPGQSSGVSGAPVTQKAAFLNPPFAYGIVERTFSEHFASALSTTPVANYASLPGDLQRGAIKRAYDQAQLAGMSGDHEDGTARFFSCQSCHMEPVVGEGAAFGISPVRYDLPKHDMTGGNTWAPLAIQWLDGQSPSLLRLGKNMSPTMTAAMDRGVLRSRAALQRAAALDVQNVDTLRVTNLTGHKLLTGYPEGRRMWLRIRWMNEQLQVIQEQGSYGSFQTTVNGQNYTVESITDPNAHVYEAKLGITQDWALQLLGMGVSPFTPLGFDRVTGAPTTDLATLATSAPGTAEPTFHFVLNNTLLEDNRIPPYGFDRDEAEHRNALPVPATAFGNPAPGGTYEHFDDVQLTPPPGATRAEIELMYQTASWEYIQFLLLANPGTSAFLASAGQELFDAYMATGKSTPEVMATARWCEMPGSNEDAVLRTSIDSATPDATCAKRVEGGDVMHFEITSPNGTHTNSLGLLVLELHQPSAPPIPGLIPGLWLDEAHGLVTINGVPPGGWSWSIQLPSSVVGSLRWQALLCNATPANGIFAATDAFDFYQD